MNERTLKALEFGKVLEHLARFCLSEAGADACRALRPKADIHAVHATQALFENFRTWASAHGRMLSGFPDIRPLFGFLHNSAAPLDADALWTLKATLTPVRPLTSSLRGSDASGALLYPVLAELAGTPLPEMTLSALIRCIGDDALIKDESSPELMLVRTELRRLHQISLRQVKDFAVRYNIAHYLQDEYMSLASDRYVLPLKANFKGRLQGIVHHYSQTGETCFFEPLFLVEQNNRIQELKREEREAEHKVLLSLSQIVRTELDSITAAWDLLVNLDVLRAKALLGDAFGGIAVTVEEGASLNLTRAVHPLLALELGGKAQPLDLVLRSDDKALIISGGNAGGKTVCLKTLGLIAIMSMAGIPIPAERGSVLPWWPKIHAFIGDEQSLDDHVSTFTAQISHLNQTWQATDARTLVLLDEFGAGTDPTQGAALAQAVVDELLERGTNVLAATHFPALKTYALTREGVRAASVLFDPKTSKPLFRLAYDQVGASHALDVAREHGLPETVLRRAEQYLLLEEDSGALLERLNALTAEREKEADVLRAETARLKEKRSRLEERFEAERKKLEAELRKSSQNIMRDWQEGKLAHKQAMRELSSLRKDLAQQAEKTHEQAGAQPSLDTLRPGQSVTHKLWNKTAVVREIDERQSRVKLDLGGVTMWADLSQIDATKGTSSPAAPAAASRKVSTGSEKFSQLSLDLRGKRADLAEEELSRFLDAALLSGREEIEIIHGRGTGVLRKQVHALLKAFPGVASYALAREDRGGDGMTVVTLR